MATETSRFDIDARRGNQELVSSVPGGALWEVWRLEMEQKLHGLNNMNSDRALLERALRDS